MAFKVAAPPGVSLVGTIADSSANPIAFNIPSYGTPSVDNDFFAFADFGYSREVFETGMGQPVPLTVFGITASSGTNTCNFSSNLAAGVALSRSGIYNANLYSSYTFTARVYQPTLADGKHTFTLLRESEVTAASISGATESLTLANTGSQVSIPAGALVVASTVCLTPLPANAMGNGDASAWGNTVPKGIFSSNSGPANSATGFEFIAWSGGDAAPSEVDGLSQYFCRVEDPGASGRYFNHVVNTGIHTGPGDARAAEFYPGLTIGRTYRVKIQARADTAGDATLEAQGFDLRTVGAGSASGTDQTTISLTTSWQEFEFDLVYSAHAASGLLYLRLNRDDAIDIDFARVTFWDTGATTGDLPHSVMQSLPTGGGNIAYRDHTMVKDHIEAASMDALTNMPEFCSRQNSIAGQLFFCKNRNYTPWIQFEWNRPDSELEDFVAYMAAPVSSGHAMALKRQAQGQTAPWTDEFDEIIFEPSNEKWQGAGNDFAGPHGVSAFTTNMVDDTASSLSRGESYGLTSQGMIDAMKGSAYWDTLNGVLTMQIGGQIGNTSEISDIDQNAPDMDAIGISGYTGGLDSGATDVWQDDGAKYTYLTQFWETQLETNATAYVTEALANGIEPWTYEWAIGYQNSSTYAPPASGGLEEEIATSTVIAGTAEMEALLGRGVLGYKRAAYFTLNEGIDFGANNYDRRGGGTKPAWQMIKALSDELGVGQIKELTSTLSANPTRDQGTINLLRAFVIYSRANPSKAALVLLNRGLDPSLLDTGDGLYSATPADNVTSVTVTLPHATYTGRKTMGTHALDWNVHNRFSVGNKPNTDWSGWTADTRCVDISLAFGSDEGSGTASTIDFGAVNAGTTKVILLEGLA